jgi:hypothetical protein
MRVFAWREVREAIDHSTAGGQSLHLHRVIPDRRAAPRCFVAAVDRGEFIAHLYDLDRERLVATARRLGVQNVYVDRDRTPTQHIDLCGGPLWAAVRALVAGERERFDSMWSELKERLRAESLTAAATD